MTRTALHTDEGVGVAVHQGVEALVVEVAMAQKFLADVAFKNRSWKNIAEGFSLGKRASHVEKEIISLVPTAFALPPTMVRNGGFLDSELAPVEVHQLVRPYSHQVRE